MGNVKPFSPTEAQVAKFRDYVPDFVIESVNETIAKNLDSDGCAKFKQDELVKLVISKMMAQEHNKYTEATARQTIFDNKWMDFEPLYREQGWKVDYDKPGYNESYPATFEFKPKR